MMIFFRREKLDFGQKLELFAPFFCEDKKGPRILVINTALLFLIEQRKSFIPNI